MWDDFEYERYIEDKIISKREKYCATCKHKDTYSEHCKGCGFGGSKYEKKDTSKPKITCLNCKYLEITLPYGECSLKPRIVNPDDTCEYAEPKEKGR